MCGSTSQGDRIPKKHIDCRDVRGPGQGLIKLHPMMDRRKETQGRSLGLAHYLDMLNKCSQGRKGEQETHSHSTRNFI